MQQLWLRSFGVAWCPCFPGSGLAGSTCCDDSHASHPYVSSPSFLFLQFFVGGTGSFAVSRPPQSQCCQLCPRGTHSSVPCSL